jgi:hypothetical protein
MTNKIISQDVGTNQENDKAIDAQTRYLWHRKIKPLPG